jgi:hypothetical protein
MHTTTATATRTHRKLRGGQLAGLRERHLELDEEVSLDERIALERHALADDGADVLGGDDLARAASDDDLRAV